MDLNLNPSILLNRETDIDPADIKEAYKRYSGEDLPLSLSMVTNREEKLKLHMILKELKAANDQVE